MNRGMSFSKMTPEEEMLLEGVTDVGRSMPSPIKPALVLGALAAGIGWIAGRSPLKWGLVTAGGSFAAFALAEGGFALGLGAGVAVSASEMAKMGCLPPPPSPVVTKGAFAGYPRPLHQAEDVPMTGWEFAGQLPQSLPEPGLPGQLVYNLDPRRDPLLDPVSRERLYPAWLLLHWQNGDPKIVAQLQQALGVPADGVVGSGTTAAIRAFQTRARLSVTGVMDRMTMEALILG